MAADAGQEAETVRGLALPESNKPQLPQMNKITITQTIRIKIGEQEHELTKEDAEALRDSLVEMLGPKKPAPKPEPTVGQNKKFQEELERLRAILDEETPKRPFFGSPFLPHYPSNPWKPEHPDFHPSKITCKTQIPTDAEVTAAMESR